MTRTTLPLLLGLVCALPAARLGAQCPNGSPPPCARQTPNAPSTNRVAVLYFAARNTAGPLESMYAGAALLAVGDTAAALDRLEHATPDPGTWSLLQWPWFDGLRGNPRFERLVAAVRPTGAVRP